MDFKPKSMDLRNLTDHSITSHCKLIEDNTLQSFQTLKDRYNLGKQDLFKHLQLQQYLYNDAYLYRAKHETKSEPNVMIQLIVQAYTKGLKKIVPNTYQGIMGSRGFDCRIY